MISGSRRYKVLIADPPWEYRNNTARGGAGRHYPTMSLSELCSLPVRDLADEDSILFLWTTWPQLPEAQELIRAWGFTYKTGLPWIKTQIDIQEDPERGLLWAPRMGNGFWLRGCSEAILLAYRGKVKPPAPEDRLLGLLAPTVKHSRKPESLHLLAERMSPGPYLELFARERRPGWDVFGNEVESSISLAEAQRQG